MVGNGRVRLRRKQFFQGHLDGLCGIYAVVNAVRLLFPRALDDDKAEALFKQALLSIKRSLPQAVWDGTDKPEMRRMINAACMFVSKDTSFPGALDYRFPFRRGRFKRIDAFWEELDPMLAQDGRVAILGFGEPDPHWTLVHRTTEKQLVLADSSIYKTLSRRRVTLAATPRKTQWILDPQETLLVTRTALS